MLPVAREERPDAEWTIGGSWLYTLEAYRRLLHPEFTAAETADERHIQYRALWGQFLLSDGTLNTAWTDDFLRRVAALDGPTQYAGRFPFQVMLTRARSDEFYRFFGV